jgi:hypothetical protein
MITGAPYSHHNGCPVVLSPRTFPTHRCRGISPAHWQWRIVAAPFYRYWRCVVAPRAAQFSLTRLSSLLDGCAPDGDRDATGRKGAFQGAAQGSEMDQDVRDGGSGAVVAMDALKRRAQSGEADRCRRDGHRGRTGAIGVFETTATERQRRPMYLRRRTRGQIHPLFELAPCHAKSDRCGEADDRCETRRGSRIGDHLEVIPPQYNR